LSVGSDSQVTRCWREELRWLEYGQRLQWRQRNVAMSHPPAAGATATRLWQAVLAGGAVAAGQTSWGLQVGARADLLVAPATDAALAGIPTSRTLDALVFSSPSQAWSDVMVAGRWTLRDGERPGKAQHQAQFTEVMRNLWGE
jgi:formimidoylglutamate deiminase